MLPGLAQRLQTEITSLAPSQTAVSVISQPNRKYSVWVGGTLIGRMPAFSEIAVSKEQYAEVGSSIVQQRFGAGF